MKCLFITSFALISVCLFAQDKNNYVNYNKLIELKETEFVVAAVENLQKMMTANSKYLLFINTSNGETKQVDFPKDSYIQNIEQIKLDSHAINAVLVVARTVNLDGNKSIDFNDPMQIFILSTDGQEKIQLTEDKYFLRSWVINRRSGTICTTGYFDTNGNGKYDKKDKNEVLVYDIKTKKLLSRI